MPRSRRCTAHWPDGQPRYVSATHRLPRDDEAEGALEHSVEGPPDDGPAREQRCQLAGLGRQLGRLAAVGTNRAIDEVGIGWEDEEAGFDAEEEDGEVAGQRGQALLVHRHERRSRGLVHPALDAGAQRALMRWTISSTSHSADAPTVTTAAIARYGMAGQINSAKTPRTDSAASVRKKFQCTPYSATCSCSVSAVAYAPTHRI